MWFPFLLEEPTFAARPSSIQEEISSEAEGLRTQTIQVHGGLLATSYKETVLAVRGAGFRRHGNYT